MPTIDDYNSAIRNGQFDLADDIWDALNGQSDDDDDEQGF